MTYFEVLDAAAEKAANGDSAIALALVAVAVELRAAMAAGIHRLPNDGAQAVGDAHSQTAKAHS